MSEKKAGFVTVARIRLDKKFEDRLILEITREGVEEIEEGKRFFPMKRASVLSVIKGEKKQAIAWTRKS